MIRLENIKVLGYVHSDLILKIIKIVEDKKKKRKKKWLVLGLN